MIKNVTLLKPFRELELFFFIFYFLCFETQRRDPIIDKFQYSQFITLIIYVILYRNSLPHNLKI